MKKLFYLIVLIVVLGLIVSGCIPVVPPSEQKADNPKNELERIVFIHYANSPPTWSSAPEPTDEDKSYRLLRGGVRWADDVLPVDYSINTAGSEVADAFAFAAVESSFETWGDAVTKEIFATPGTTDNTIVDLAWAKADIDEENSIVWGNYSEPEVIAVTIVWYWKTTREIEEFDMVLDTDYTWGDATVDSTVMDVQNIATHEAGHTLFLDDLYVWKQAELTMYGYSTEGETKKQTLGTGDILGIQRLYGE